MWNDLGYVKRAHWSLWWGGKRVTKKSLKNGVLDLG